MTDTVFEAFLAGFVDLAPWEDLRVFAPHLPLNAELPCAVLTPYGGAPNEFLPTGWQYVQVNVYAANSLEALTLATAAFDALHRRKMWVIDGWLLGIVLAQQPPFYLPPADGRGEKIYRAVFNARFWYREA